MGTRVVEPLTTADSIRKLLEAHPRKGRLERMPADRRALYERIVKRRDRIGPINFNIVEALRELRGDE